MDMSLTLEWNSELEEEIPGEWIDMLRIILQRAGSSEGVTEGEVALTFVDNESIRELNRTYRGIDAATDVLSFAMQESSDEEPGIRYDEDFLDEQPEGELLGDIVISVPRAREQSEEYGHSIQREIGFLFVHGFLHLLGYDHQNEEAERLMFAKQEQILSEVGLAR
jgi:probable rRNA maturation factor